MVDFVTELKKSINITEIVGEYVKLRKQGGNFTGLCPFHAERTPSFSVSDKKGVFYCFGCQKGGDVVTFLQEVQGIPFHEAIRYLAVRAGVAVPPEFASSSKKTNTVVSDQQRLEVYYKLNRFVSQFYHEKLMGSEGAQARAYLKARGVHENTIKTAYLGYAPAPWDELYRFLTQKKAPLEIAEKLGLIRRKSPDASGREYYDLFRHRVMFPVLDRQGRVVAFGGRALPHEGEEGQPKYLNSSESAIFTKGQHLYGLFQAQKHIRADDLCLIVEGYMDCLALQQAGVEAVVATLGTALSEAHVRQLKRLTQNIIFVFDGDEAGKAAQHKAMQAFLGEGVMVRGVTIPDELDPDEYIQSYGVEKFRELIQNAPYLLDQYIASLKAQPYVNAENRGRALDLILPLISKLGSSTAKLIHLQDLSEHFGVPFQILERKLQTLARDLPEKIKKVQLRNMNFKTRQHSQKIEKFDRLDEVFLEFVIRFPKIVAQWEHLESVWAGLESRDLKMFAQTILEKAQNSVEFDSSLVDSAPTPGLKDLSSRVLALADENELLSDDNQKQINDLLKSLTKRGLEKQHEQLKIQIKQAEALGQNNEVLKLMQEFNQILRLTKGGQV